MFSSILEQKSLLTPRAEGLRDALVIPGWLPTPTALDKLPWFAMVLLTSGARFALHIAFSASRDGGGRMRFWSIFSENTVHATRGRETVGALS
jgi:hypothetical protein